MFRFKIYFSGYVLTSNSFDSIKECDKEREISVNLIGKCGSSLEEYIDGIGWVSYIQ